MIYNFLADLVVILHLLFVLFVLLGGFLVLWKPHLAWFHIPAVLWAASIEFFGWICLLTPLENLLRGKGGITGYDAGFVEHYIIPVLYPDFLSRQIQINLGIIVLSINVAIYVTVWMRMREIPGEQE